MLFRIDGPPGGGGDIPEYGLIELQGRIEQQHDVAPGEPLPVGTVVLSKTNPDVVKITIGYHEIEGKRLALKRPLAILERQPAAAAGDADAAAAASSAAQQPQTQGFNVVGVVRHRFLFKGRPRALISKPAGAAQPMAAKHRQQQREEAERREQQQQQQGQQEQPVPSPQAAAAAVG